MSCMYTYIVNLKPKKVVSVSVMNVNVSTLVTLQSTANVLILLAQREGADELST